MEKRHQAEKLIIGAVIAIIAFLFAGGIFGGKPMMYHLQDRGDLGPLTRDDIVLPDTEAPEATSLDGTVSAADWKGKGGIYDKIAVSMGNTRANTYVIDYLEQDPYLVNIYEGYGFAKDYGSARGHEYTLEDVEKTLRPHGQAKCLTCKTPNFAKLVNDNGLGVYRMDFNEALNMMEENVSCYSCHGNSAGNGGERVITHSYVLTALGDNAAKIDPSTLVCGQCHIEYYFTPSDDETMMPYHDVSGMHPDAILAYYDGIGFSDWTQPSTGANLLKAQHPEMETYLLGVHAKEGLNCADCHMAVTQDEDGTVYHSHDLVSPLDDAGLLLSCAQCHPDTDMADMVHALQRRVTDRETEVGNRLSAFKDALAKAVSSGTADEAVLEKARLAYRHAQWYFDFCYVENAEGAHNSELAFYCLDTSDAKIDEGMKLLGY